LGIAGTEDREFESGKDFSPTDNQGGGKLMRNILAIFKRDLRGYFSSPIAYVIIGLFVSVTGIFFYLLLSSFVQYSYALMMQQQNAPLNVNLMMVRPFLLNLSVIILFIVPMITMRAFSEEKKSGTIELLLTAPLTNWQIISGKFLATYVLFLAMTGITFLYMIFLFLWGNPEIGPILIGYLGLLFFGAALIATGNFISSLTENQIVAAVGTFAVAMFLWIIGFAADSAGKALGSVLGYLSIVEHFEDFSKGIFDTSHLVYYLSVVTVMLFLTFQSVESAKWRS
jgi:ABC-2 type transport system permease protein